MTGSSRSDPNPRARRSQKLGRLEVGVLGDLRGELVVAHDHEAAVAFNHVVEDILSVADHFLDEMRSLLQCEVGNVFG